jgi:3-aminobutyryl-CoA ammonia-lyase
LNESLLRVRISSADAHYAGNLVDGAHILALFGDAATELLIRHDGDEGLFVAYDLVAFKAPVYAGDYIEIRARITQVGKTSRKMTFEAYKVIAGDPSPEQPSRAKVLDPPILVTRASGTCIVPEAFQRARREGQ